MIALVQRVSSQGALFIMEQKQQSNLNEFIYTNWDTKYQNKHW